MAMSTSFLRATLLANLALLNELTRYPDIPQYQTHNDEFTTHFEEDTCVAALILAGYHVRLIVDAQGHFAIAEGDEFIGVKGDVLLRQHIIVRAIEDRAELVASWWNSECSQHGRTEVLVIYGTLLMSTGEGFEFRFFDAWSMSYSAIEMALDYSGPITAHIDSLTTWRNRGKQPFFHEQKLVDLQEKVAMAVVERCIMPRPPRTNRKSVKEWLTIAASQFDLDQFHPGAGIGIEIRNEKRSTIAIATFRDYTS